MIAIFSESHVVLRSPGRTRWLSDSKILILSYVLRKNGARMPIALVHTDKMAWTAASVTGFAAKEPIRESHGTAKLIRLIPGVHYPEPRRPGCTGYIYVMTGILSATVAGEHQTASPRDFAIVPPNVPHTLTNRSRDRCRIVGRCHYARHRKI